MEHYCIFNKMYSFLIKKCVCYSLRSILSVCWIKTIFKTYGPILWSVKYGVVDEKWAKRQMVHYTFH